jgi:formylglycine-generating enzyme required for sulfatase activity
LVSREQWEELDSMVRIEAGSFFMGTNLERADEQDKPQHKVMLPTFYLDKYLVTNAQYARFVAATQHRPPLNWKTGAFRRASSCCRSRWSPGTTRPLMRVGGQATAARDRIRKGRPRH